MAARKKKKPAKTKASPSKKKVVSKKATKKSVTKKSVNKKSSSNSNMMAAISYLWIAGLVILLTEKKDNFVKYHAKQATALFLIETIAGLSFILMPVAIIAGLAALYGLIMALQGKKAMIPIAYELGNWIAGLMGVK